MVEGTWPPKGERPPIDYDSMSPEYRAGLEKAVQEAKALLNSVAPSENFNEDLVTKDFIEGTGVIIGKYELILDEKGNLNKKELN